MIPSKLPKPKQIINRRRHEFLLTFFTISKDKEDKYEIKEVNGFFLVKQFNGGSNKWEVAIHTKETLAKVNEWKQEQLL